MAVLTRPNLVPLAAVLGGYYLWQIHRSEGHGRKTAVGRVLLFVAAAVPALLRTLRASHIDTPVLILSALGEVDEELVGGGTEVADVGTHGGKL